MARSGPVESPMICPPSAPRWWRSSPRHRSGAHRPLRGPLVPRAAARNVAI